jgi:hypothetical protein
VIEGVRERIGESEGMEERERMRESWKIHIRI